MAEHQRGEVGELGWRESGQDVSMWCAGLEVLVRLPGSNITRQTESSGLEVQNLKFFGIDGLFDKIVLIK